MHTYTILTATIIPNNELFNIKSKKIFCHAVPDPDYPAGSATICYCFALSYPFVSCNDQRIPLKNRVIFSLKQFELTCFLSRKKVHVSRKVTWSERNILAYQTNFYDCNVWMGSIVKQKLNNNKKEINFSDWEMTRGKHYCVRGD